MTREEMLETMSARELVAWRMYDELEPIGEPRADLRAALLLNLFQNVHRKEGSKPVELDQSLLQTPDALVKPKTEEEKELELAERIRAALMSLPGKKREKEA